MPTDSTTRMYGQSSFHTLYAHLVNNGLKVETQSQETRQHRHHGRMQGLVRQGDARQADGKAGGVFTVKDHMVVIQGGNVVTGMAP